MPTEAVNDEITGAAGHTGPGVIVGVGGDVRVGVRDGVMVASRGAGVMVSACGVDVIVARVGVLVTRMGVGLSVNLGTFVGVT